MVHIRHILILFVAFIGILPLAYAQNNPPVAVTDYDTTNSGGGGLVWVLNNDTDPDGNNLTLDTAWMDTVRGTVQAMGGIVINYSYENLYYGIDTIYYVVCDDGVPSLCDTGLLIVTVNYKMFEAFEYLDINMVKARFNANGSDFWNNLTGEASYEVPKGSGKHTMFITGLWIAGKDTEDSLHLASTIYNGPGQDIYTGPIMDSSEYSFSQDSLWNRFWRVNKTDIDYHIANWNQPGYTAIDVILTWPGNGDISKGQAAQLAPYYDRMNDQIYDPYDGDYPLIKGDQTVYFIRNDDRAAHAQSGGGKMMIEIHGMAYAFDCSSDSALFTSIFVNYKIVNRSNISYDSTYVGIFTDFDIGDFTDDYIGCDVERGSFFGYNGTEVDGTGSPNHYGQYPPAQSVTFLRGPLIDSDGLDNAKGGCDASINGLGFGDGITDNEHFGMTHFMSICNPGPGCNGVTQGDPINMMQYYNFLRGIWKDGTRMRYGGNGHIMNCTSCEYANFMFSNLSDSCNWGVCGDPNNQNCGLAPIDTMPWTEQAAGNSPYDRRGIGSMGPFTFGAGDTIEIDIAYVFGRDYVDSINNYASVYVMKERIDSVRSYFNANLTPCGGVFTSTERHAENIPAASYFTVYPNPATQTLNVKISGKSGKSRYAISDLAGRNIQSGTLGNESSIDISSIGEGIFILRVLDGERSYYRKFVKM